MNAVSRLKNKNLFRKDTPLYVTILLVLASSLVVYGLFPHPESGKKTPLISLGHDCTPEIDILRSKDYKLTHRILLSDMRNENPKLASIKERISQTISENKISSTANDVSVYFRNLNDGSWFEINGGSSYSPASLLKVSFLIAILKQAEGNPGLLSKQVYFEKHFAKSYNQNIKTFSLEEKKNYTIKELLYNMIVYSDNDALTLLSSYTDSATYDKLFWDLGMTPPSKSTKPNEYNMTIMDYCKFFRVLYNSAYLKEEYSEFALELLTKSTYKEGLVKNIAGDFPVAHKFGERIAANGSVQELHEVGIFYVDHKPYLLGVMSTGHDLKQLSAVLSRISEIVYRESSNFN
jgi:beta-lactamase class A